MTLSDFNTSIRSLIEFFDSVELWIATVNISSLSRSEEFNKVSLTTKNYSEIYEKGLSLSHYNFLLKDLAYFQFSFNNEGDYALAYYPNPRISGSADAFEFYKDLEHARSIGEIDEEEFADLASAMPTQIYVPRIRFEYSAGQYKPVKHPGAHFHIGMSGEDRWCSGRQISPKTFGLLMAKFYYPQVWWGNSRFSLDEREHSIQANIDNCFDEHLLSSMKRDGVSQHMTDYERMSFHFSALQSRHTNE